MRPYQFLLVLLALSAISSPGALAADAAPDMDAGFKLLKEKNYEQALEIFNTAARANPDSVDAHFGRAQALEAIGRRPESVKEFQLCLLLKPTAAVAAVCNKELDYMTTRVPPVAPLPTLSEREVEKAGTTITNQAAERIQALQRDCSFASRPPRMIARRPIGMPIGYPYASKWSTPYAARAEEARRRGEALREAAEGLRTGMSTKPSAWDGIYLSPQGTNLYVRNYVTFDAQKPEVIEPLKADQLSFADIKKNCPQKKK